MTGTVLWWDPRRGAGRLKADSPAPGTNGETYPFTKRGVAADQQRRTFKRGERVAFEGERNADGRYAIDVRPQAVPAPKAPR